MPISLTKKVGPAPLWAWGLGAILLVGMVIYFRRAQPAENAVDLTPPDDGMIRGDDGSEFTGLVGGGAGNLGNGTGTPYTDPVIPPDPYYPPVYDPGPIYETPQAPTTYTPDPEPAPAPTPVQTTKTVTPAKQTSFQWGGKTWYKKDYAAFKAWLKKRGVTYASWAKKHPKAAMDVFGRMT